MSYQISYLLDIEHKFDFMNVRYEGHTQAPIGYWPLEFSNLENIKTIEQGCLVKGLNEVTTRLGALAAIPLTMLDITITVIAGAIISSIYPDSFDYSGGLKTCIAVLSNRMCGNLVVLALIATRLLVGSRAPDTEQKIDRYITNSHMIDNSWRYTSSV